jgi:hypothetical protein
LTLKPRISVFKRNIRPQPSIQNFSEFFSAPAENGEFPANHAP